MRHKRVIPRTLANLDIEQAIAVYLDQQTRLQSASSMPWKRPIDN